MCRKQTAAVEPLVALMSEKVDVVNDVVQRFQVATREADDAAAVDGDTALTVGGGATPAGADNVATAECKQRMTVALSVSLSLTAIVLLLLMFVLGWHCGVRMNGGAAMRIHDVKPAAMREHQVAVAVLDLETAMKPPPPVD